MKFNLGRWLQNCIRCTIRNRDTFPSKETRILRVEQLSKRAMMDADGGASIQPPIPPQEQLLNPATLWIVAPSNNEPLSLSPHLSAGTPHPAFVNQIAEIFYGPIQRLPLPGEPGFIGPLPSNIPSPTAYSLSGNNSTGEVRTTETIQGSKTERFV